MDPSKLYSAGSHNHVKTSALQAAARAWAASEADYFSRSHGSLAKLEIGGGNSQSFSWKMFQLSGLEEPTLLSENWPASGMVVDGVLYPLRTWERTIAGKDGGFWPTASARDWKDKPGMARVRPDGKSRTDQLARAVYAKQWPTPRAEHDSGRHRGKPDTLHSAVKQWPTPKGSASGPDFARMSRPGSGGDDLATAIARETGGTLNPQFVEWLMAFPSEWTVCAPWATPSSNTKRAKRLKGS